MATYLTSDPHINHGNIIKYARRDIFLEPYEIARLNVGNEDWKVRPESVAEMNATILNGINSLVQPDDTLWILGDIGFGYKGNYKETIRQFREAIHCKIVNIVKGNHDRGSIGEFFSNCHEKIPNTVECVIEGQSFLFSHQMDQYASVLHPTIHCYGHSHAYYEVERDKTHPRRRSIDVGIDNAFRLFGNYRPFLLNEVIEIVNKR